MGDAQREEHRAESSGYTITGGRVACESLRLSRAFALPKRLLAAERGSHGMMLKGERRGIHRGESSGYTPSAGGRCPHEVFGSSRAFALQERWGGGIQCLTKPSR